MISLIVWFDSIMVGFAGISLPSSVDTAFTTISRGCWLLSISIPPDVDIPIDSDKKKL